MRPIQRLGPLADYLFITLLLILAAIPLIMLRGSVLLKIGLILFAFYTTWLGMFALWLVATRDGGTSHTDDQHLRPVPDRAASLKRSFKGLAIASLLLAFTIVTFYTPMKQHFWGGGDEHGALIDDSLWSDVSDLGFGRPLLKSAPFIAITIVPGRVDGFLWLTVLLVYLNGILLFGILRQFYGETQGVALAAALLLIASPAEPTRYMALWTGIFYYSAVFWLLLSLWLFVLSYWLGRKWLLVISCVTLGLSLLTYEGGFPLALVGPVLLIMSQRRPHRRLWLYTWLGALLLLAVRFTVSQVARDFTYQKFLFQSVRDSGGVSIGHIPSSLLIQLKPTLGYLLVPGRLSAVATYWRQGLVAAAIAALVLWLASGRSKRPTPHAMRLASGWPVAFAALLLAIIPFVPLSGVFGAFRTQFYAIPAQAALWAVTIGLLANWLPRRFWRWGLVVGIVPIVMASTLSSFHMQAETRRTSPVWFEKTVAIYQQVHELAPVIAPDTLVLFVLDDNQASPLGVNYHVYNLSSVVLGVRAYPANYVDQLGDELSLSANGVTLGGLDGVLEYEPPAYGYDELVAFRLASEGQVSLLEALPPGLLPPGATAEDYAPHERIQEGEPTDLPYLRYSRWMTPYKPPPDITMGEEGIVLGTGWEAVVQVDGEAFRWVIRDAEVVVTAPQSHPRLMIELEPGPDYASLEIELLDRGGQVVATLGITGRTTEEVELPLDAGETEVYSLRVKGSEEVAAIGGKDMPLYRVFSLRWDTP